jgi:hypothetical protein
MYLAQPIAGGVVHPVYSPQTAYIHPRIRADFTRYFDWIGAAMYTADRYAGAMHGKVFLLESIYAGIDEDNLYGRVDFSGGVPKDAFDLVVTVECGAAGEVPSDSAPGGLRRTGMSRPSTLRLELSVSGGVVQSWRLRPVDAEAPIAGSDIPYNNTVRLTLFKNFEFQVPLAIIGAEHHRVIRLRFSVWRDRLPIDALPVEGSIEIPVLPEAELEASAYNYSAHH